MSRTEFITHFLDHAGWGEAARAPLAGDASNRRYERLTNAKGACAVLMDAPPEKGEDVRPFVHIAEYLGSQGLSAPRILAKDEARGLLLLEDLGDALFARVVSKTPEKERPLYEAATDVLLTLHAAKPPLGLKTYDASIKAEMAALAYRWYGAMGQDALSEKSAAFETAFQALLETHFDQYPVLIQRDYHAENLLWLPERDGVARVGLLDFQDAMLGHPAYDLVSLLQDARRDVPQSIEQEMTQRYCEAAQLEHDKFLAEYALLGAQRNLRILGVFGRLSLHYNKPHYVDFIPRVWRYLQHDLEHPALEPVRDMVRADLPEPTETHLTELKNQCGTIQTL